MSAEFGAPKQHRQSSRKGKRAWRKNVDITEVQDGLRALREEIIQTGSGPVSEQKSEDLFAVDITGSEDVRRKLKSSKPLKVDEILAKRSAVPAVDSRKRSGPRIGDDIPEPASKRHKKDWVSKKEVQRLRQVASATSHLDRSQLSEDEEHNASIDLWAITERPKSREEMHGLEYIPKVRAKVAPSTIRRAPIAMTVSGKATKSIPNPEAGTSYNPDFEQWDALLTREGAKAVAVEQARLAKEQEAQEQEARVNAIARRADAKLDEDSTWEGFETDGSDLGIKALKAKRPQRKTPAERNKIKRRKEAERQAKHEQKMVREHTRNLSLVLSQESEDNKTVTINGGREGEEPDSETSDIRIRRRRLGNTTIPQENLEIVLPDELQESLRQLKPEGNLLQDRFRNLLVNGKIESRKPVLQPKKKKVKVTEKWSYKDFEVHV